MKFQIVLMFLVSTIVSAVPLSECKYARATYYPIARTNGIPQGTCGFGPVSSSMPSTFTAGYVTAPDDETYNGYPFLSDAISITTGGIGKACGECFEITGPSGTITVINADICDKGCCENCQGSLAGDVQAFDIEAAVWRKIVNQSGGNVPVSYRKVTCNTEGKTVGFFFSDQGTPNAWWFRIRLLNYVVGIQDVQVKSDSSSSSTGGNWTSLTRGWTGSWDWSSMGNIGFPFMVRAISIYNQTITWSKQFQSTDFVQLVVYASGSQFTAPSFGYPTETCEWSGPERQIYTDQLNGALFIKWRHWGGTEPDWASTINPHSGSHCINYGQLAAWDMPQIGYQTLIPSKWFSGFSFWIRSSGESSYSSLVVFWKSNSNEGTESTSKINVGAITSTWKFVNISFSQLLPLPVNINVLCFQNAMNSASPVSIFLDDIQLLGHDSSIIPDVPETSSNNNNNGNKKKSEYLSGTSQNVVSCLLIPLIGLLTLL